MTTTAKYRSAAEIGHTTKGPRPLPALGELRTAEPPAVASMVLANGLQVIAMRSATVPMVELRLRIPFAGNEIEHAARANLLAASLLAGTRRRTRVQIDAELALVGAALDVSVAPENLAITGSSLAIGLDRLLEVLADILTEPAYAADEVIRERDRLAENIEVARSQPGVIAREALLHRCYGSHPYTRDVPEAAQVNAVTVEEVRELHHAAVVPAGASLVLVGDIDPSATLSLVQRALAGWQSDRVATTMASLPAVHGDDVLLVHRPGAVQSQIRLISEAVSRQDPAYPALHLANLAYGGYFSSRLVENIRENKGYTYHAHSRFTFTGNGATVMIDADTANKVTAAALLETRYELGRLCVVPPTEAEVDSVRQYAIGSLLIGTSAQASLATQLSALVGVGLDHEWLREYPSRLAAVTSAQVAEAARKFFTPTRFTGVVVGDADVLATSLVSLGGVLLP